MKKPSFKKFSPLSLWGPIVEAWEELIINKGRIILSLTGVAAAVWAMATVLALGGVMSVVQEEAFSQWNGRPGTVKVTVTPSASESGLDEPLFSEDNGSSIFNGDFIPSPIVGPDDFVKQQRDLYGKVVDPFADASLRTAEILKVNYWTRERTVWNVRIQAPGMLDCLTQSDGTCPQESPTFLGIDPGYFEIYSYRLLHGRLLTAKDGNLQMNPVVVSSKTWELLNRPDLRSYPRFRLQADANTVFTVVGVVETKNEWDSPMIFANYETFNAALPDQFLQQASTRTFSVVAPEKIQKKARDVIAATLQGKVGPKWSVQPEEGGFADFGNLNTTFTVILAAIGGIVIALGALGLLTVSIVTVRFRVREIGIRRAMGASAKRIFLSVFLESVVATTVAGFIGVILSILTIRVSPLLSWMQIPVDVNTLAYPMQAAMLGVLIAAGVGALAGIIPATIAIRVKPIDAIRF